MTTLAEHPHPSPLSLSAPGARNRLDSIDLLRGLVIILMALDHVRDFITSGIPDPVRLVPDPTFHAETTPAIFITRWLTHFCAPVFVFLAGTGAFLYGARGRTTRQVSWFLFSRGLWLALLELTWVRCIGWSWNFDVTFQGVGVLWAIGWSMVVLSVLVYLPLSAIATFGVLMIAFHNLFDGQLADEASPVGWLWSVLHSGQTLHITWEGGRLLWEIPVVPPGVDLKFVPHTGIIFTPGYPLIPWMGVMAAGFAFGSLYLLEPTRRRRQLGGLGVTLVLAFIVLRYTNAYGDKPAPEAGAPGPWAVYPDTPWKTVASFVNCQKYPPSLLYLLMTLGPAITAVALFERSQGWLVRFLVLFGRVPLFFYLLHLPLIHAVALGMVYYRDHMVPAWLFNFPPPMEDGFPLWLVYPVWVGVVLLLYWPCRWWASIKRRYAWTWLSYL